MSSLVDQPCYTLINVSSDAEPPTELQLRQDLGESHDFLSHYTDFQGFMMLMLRFFFFLYFNVKRSSQYISRYMCVYISGGGAIVQKSCC